MVCEPAQSYPRPRGPGRFPAFSAGMAISPASPLTAEPLRPSSATQNPGIPLGTRESGFLSRHPAINANHKAQPDRAARSPHQWGSYRPAREVSSGPPGDRVTVKPLI